MKKNYSVYKNLLRLIKLNNYFSKRTANRKRDLNKSFDCFKWILQGGKNYENISWLAYFSLAYLVVDRIERNEEIEHPVFKYFIKSLAAVK